MARFPTRSNRHCMARSIGAFWRISRRPRRRGAWLLLDGRGKGPEQGYYIGPTILGEVSRFMPMAPKDVFGPVLVLLPFDGEAEALETANGTIYGLAAGIWTGDVARALRPAERVEAGAACINSYFGAVAHSPAGGYRQSGFGRESGVGGMRACLQCRPVWLAAGPREPVRPLSAEVQQGRA